MPYRLVRDCFDELINHRRSEISKRFGISVTDVQNAADEIAKLDPKPGLVYSESGDNYIIPDLVIDKIDGDPDLEDGADDEPDLGSNERWGQGKPEGFLGIGGTALVDAELDTADSEPSLGAYERHPSIWGGGGSQLDWAKGSREDLELADDDLEESDHSGAGDLGGLLEMTHGEPSLGATVDINQVIAWKALSEAEWFVEDGEKALWFLRRSERR